MRRHLLGWRDGRRSPASTPGPGRCGTRSSQGWLAFVIGVAASQVVATFYGSPSAAQLVLLERRDVIAELPEFTDAPLGAELLREQRATGCEDAYWAADTPSAYREYKIAPTARQQAVQELRRSWEQAGWRLTNSTDWPGEYGEFHDYSKELAGGWTAGLTVYIDSATLVTVTGRPSGDTACD